MMRLKLWVKCSLVFAVLAPCAALVFLKQVGEDDSVSRIPSSMDIEEAGRERNLYSLADWQSVNPDVYLVLHIEGVEEAVSLPVVSTVDPDYALGHDLLGRQDPAGMIFIARNELAGENKVIYGHASRSENVRFTFLRKFQEARYFEQNRYVDVESAMGNERYTIVSFGAYDLSQPGVYTGWADSDFEEGGREKMFLETVPYLLKKRSGIVYDGRGMVTMVTCEAGSADRRFVLQAVRAEDPYG